MHRNLKALGPALVAVFAMSAVISSSAAAVTHTFTMPGAGPSDVTHLTTSAITAQVFKPTPTSIDTFSCSKVFVEGSFEGSTAASLTITPKYEECEVAAGESRLSANVTTNNCHFKFTGETTETPSGTPGEHATVHIEACGEDAKTHTHAVILDYTSLKVPCIEIPEQTLHGARYNNKESGGTKDIELELTTSEIESKTLGACKVAGEPETHNNGTYTGKVTLSGHNDPGEPTSVSVNPG